MARIGFRSKLFRVSLSVVGSESEALLVATGAIPGAWLRLKVVNHFQPMLPKKYWGTFVVNVTACFFLGFVLAQVERCGPMTGLVLLIGVGFLGSLSTFSTFVVEVFNELQAGHVLPALVLMISSLLMGLVTAAFGYGLGFYV